MQGYKNPIAAAQVTAEVQVQSHPTRCSGLKDQGLLQLQCRSQLWPRFNPWRRELPYAGSMAIKFFLERKEKVLLSFFFSLLSFFFFFFFFLGPHLQYHGGSQARGRIGATAASLCHSHSNARFKLCLQPTPQLMAMLDPQPTEQDQGSSLSLHGS